MNSRQIRRRMHSMRMARLQAEKINRRFLWRLFDTMERMERDVDRSLSKYGDYQVKLNTKPLLKEAAER